MIPEFREPNISEIFSLATKKNLLESQAAHLVYHSIKSGGDINKALENIPINTITNQTIDLFPKPNNLFSLVFIYAKKHWPTILLVGLASFAAGYLLAESRKYNTPKIPSTPIPPQLPQTITPSPSELSNINPSKEE